MSKSKLIIKFNYEFLQSIRGYFHLLTVILGLIIVAVGWHSYFKSEWTSLYKDLKSFLNGTTIVVPENNFGNLQYETFHLPNLLKEQIFLGISLASFCTSLIIYVIYLLGLQDRHQSAETLWSILYHLSGSAALIIVGGLLMLSAVKIDEFNEDSKRIPLVSDIVGANTKIQLFGEKISAGIVSIVNGLIFGVIAALSRHEAMPKTKKVRLFRKHTNTSS